MANRKPKETKSSKAVKDTLPPAQDTTPPAQDATPPAPAAALSEESALYFGQAGQAYGRSAKAQYERDAELAQHLKECTTFELWELARVRFEAGATSVGYAAANQLWQDTLARCRAASMIGDKPKAATAEATKKAAQREAAKKAAEAKQAELAKVNVEAATAEMVKAATAGDAKKAAEIAATITAAKEAADKKAKAAAQDAVAKAKAELDRCVKAIRATGDAALIVKAYKALQPLVPKAAKAS